MFDIFSLPAFTMPEGFLWGSGYAGHQVEGDNIHSQWWRLEQERGFKELSGRACNSYELWERDVEIAQECGLQVFRTSVEWSRIEPEEGHFDQAAVDHYVRLFAALKERGIRVFATMVHISHPQWFEELLSFEKLENRCYFERYLEFVVPQIAPYVDFWNVMNEFNLGNDPHRVDFKLNSIQFHALGYHVIKKYSDKPVSTAHALVQYMAKRPFDRFDQTMAQFNDLRDHEFFFHAIRTGEILYPYRDGVYAPEVKDSVDFWSVNTYVRDLVDARLESSFGPRYPFKRMQMLDRPFYLEEFNPECVVANLSRLTDKPVYISENGCSCDDDRFRIVFIAQYLSAVREAIRLGVDVRGYLYWSMLDNYEWGSFKPRFGLYDVDLKTFERTPKPSSRFYREVIAQNGVTPELIARCLDEIPSLVK
ncbi:MAG: glycoside hydrolase family 1 protein [Clostridia bacterium]|nr:glycoside hydrolase family 1 protein [Clostridia bacterium]